MSCVLIHRFPAPLCVRMCGVCVRVRACACVCVRVCAQPNARPQPARTIHHVGAQRHICLGHDQMTNDQSRGAHDEPFVMLVRARAIDELAVVGGAST